ncbi:MAG: circularly permuted type 2 ATP-grasp protein [Luteolibacter sp.]
MSSRLRFSSAFAPASEGAVTPAWNEMLDRQGRLRPIWQSLSAKISRWTVEERSLLATSAGKMLEDLGTTFNVYSDVSGTAQPYEIDPIPLLVSQEEWERVSGGLSQRVKLLEVVLADVYGPQELLKQGLLPPDLVHANPAFIHGLKGIQPPGNQHLGTTGCDLIRAPNGIWTVLKDHTGSPGGLGQALENRSVTSNLLPEEFDQAKIAPLKSFFETNRSNLQTLSGQRREEPSIVFLTPGFRHPSYFEHVYMARLLGFPIVEPADLTVRERRVFLKTLSGLRKIDGIVSRIHDNFLDPLEFWNVGGGGVPGLVEAWRSGNVTLSNAPGSSFASTTALMPFLPAISRAWFGEDLKLPFVETWWLGQLEIRQSVLNDLGQYVLMSAFGNDPLLPVRCGSLSPAARRQWISTIEERPHDFVVQRDIPLSIAPSLQLKQIQSRSMVWRAFTLHSGKDQTVLPGGLARVGKAGEPPQLWPAHAGFTKDVWIPAQQIASSAREATNTVRATAAHHPAGGDVPSRIAEQLYWVGRYAERVEMVTRILRVILRSLIEESNHTTLGKLDASQQLVIGAGLIFNGQKIQPSRILDRLASLVHDSANESGLPRFARSLLWNASAARDRLSDDTWRFFNRLEGLLQLPQQAPSAAELLRTLDHLVLHLAAFSGMQAENMTRGHGWRFLETGRRIERLLGTLALLHSTADLCGKNPLVLDVLLEICDSVMTYRRRHFSRPRWDGVVDLLFFDAENPRSVAYQIGIIHQELAHFPGDHQFGLFPKISSHVEELAARFETAAPPSSGELEALVESLEVLSDLLTQHYFSHSVRRVY